MEKATVSPLTRRQWWAVLAVLLLAFLLRIGLIVTLTDDPFFYEPIVDAAAYDRWAQEIAWQDFWGDRAFYQDPLYPYFLGITYAIFGRDLVFIRVIQSILAILGCLCLLQVGRRLGGFRVGFAALCLSAVAKTLVFYDVALLKEMFSVVLVEAALLALVSAEGRWWLYLLGGIALGAGGLVRGNLLLLVVAVAVWTRSWKRAGLVIGGSLIAVLPVTVRNMAVDEFVLTTYQFGPNLYIGNNEHNATGRYRPPPFLAVAAPGFEEEAFRSEAERITQRPKTSSEIDAFWRARATDYILEHPFLFAWVSFKRFLLFINRYEIADNYSIEFYHRYSWILYGLLPFGVLLPAAVVGIWRAWRKHSLLTVFLGTYAVSILPFFMFARYRLPVIPVLILFAALGLVEVVGMLRGRMRTLPRTAAVVFVVALAFVNFPIEWIVDVGPLDTATSHINLGYRCLNIGRNADAVDELEEAIRVRPGLADRADVRYAAGTARARLNDVAGAVEHLDRASELAPRNHLPLMELGRMYLRVGDPLAAARVLGSAVVREPHDIDAHLLLGRCYAKREPHEAVRVWDQARTFFPRDPRLPLEIMRLYLGVGDKVAARRYARDVLRLSPGHPEAASILKD